MSKLPVWRTVKEAVSLIWQKRAFVLRISWPYAVVTMLALAIDAGVAPETTLTAPPGGPDTSATTGDAGRPGDGMRALIGLAQGFFLCILAIYWHRNILLHESDVPAVPLRFDIYLWRFIGVVLLLALVFMVMMAGVGGLAFWLMSGPVMQAAPVVTIVMLSSALLGLTMLLRLGLVMPAAAIGDRDMSLKESWRLTRGNTLRLLAIQFIMLACVSVAATALAMLAAELGDAGTIVRFAGDSVLTWASSLAGLAVLSLVYDWLKREAPPRDAELAG